jgi:hypothetical protein
MAAGAARSRHEPCPEEPPRESGNHRWLRASPATATDPTYRNHRESGATIDGCGPRPQPSYLRSPSSEAEQTWLRPRDLARYIA